MIFAAGRKHHSDIGQTADMKQEIGIAAISNTVRFVDIQL